MAGLNLFTNNAATTLASSINSSVTSLTVASATGGLFPNPTAGQYFYATLQNTAGSVVEIVKVTARSTDTFTIVRAQDNTTASAFTAGDKVELRATAADLNNFGQLDSTNTWALAQTFSSPIAATSGGTAQSTYTTGDIIYASGTNTLSKLAIGTTGQALTVSGGVPAWAAAGGSTSLTTTSFTATAGQTSFTVSYTPSLVQGVYRNGVKLDPADYTATSGTAIVLSAAAALNDNIQVQYFTALSTLATPLAVSLGGTGLTTLTAANYALYSTSSSALTAGTLPIAAGGTGATSAATVAGTGITVSGTFPNQTINAVGSTLNSQTSAYILAATDAGKVVSITTGGVTVNNSIMSAGNIVTIYNNSGSSQTITQGTGVTLQWAGQSSSTTGNRTLALYGIATILFLSASSAVITGSGLT
jgi:hypothetical protein